MKQQNGAKRCWKQKNNGKKIQDAFTVVTQSRSSGYTDTDNAHIAKLTPHPVAMVVVANEKKGDPKIAQSAVMICHVTSAY